MKAAIFCEESQAITIEMRKRGIECYSVDLQDCSGRHPEWHIKGDAIEEAYSGKYDLMVAHPPCTFLANSGVRWLNIIDGKITNRDRFQNMLWASRFFRDLLNAPIKYKAIENPIPHKYAGLPKYDQIIQPWQFGEMKMKATCLWLNGLPPLLPTNIVGPPPKEKSERNKWQEVWLMPPGPERQKLRSKTYPGIAAAIAEQWGRYVINLENNKSKVA